MEQYVLQNIPKVKPMCSAGCPKDGAVCPSEYHADKANVFYRMS